MSRTTPFHEVSTSELRRAPSANENDVPGERRGPVDPHVARAIAAMKAEPCRDWTVAALARVGGLSRAAFARRFKKAEGVAPVRWLTEHRLRHAQRRLVETDLGLAGIATEIGYESEFSFAKAFKRLFGVAPGSFRRTALRNPPVSRVRAELRAAA